MSTTSDIVRRALRAMGAISRGQEPSGADLEDGLERLQSLVLDLPGLHHAGRWRDVAVTGTYTACEGERCTVTGSGAVTLPTTVTDCHGARPPRDLAKVLIIGTAATNAGLWLYSASKGAWGQADALTADDEMPFGAEYDEGLAAQLAVNMVDEYGAEVSARTIGQAQTSARTLRTRLQLATPRDMSRPDACDEERPARCWDYI